MKIIKNIFLPLALTIFISVTYFLYRQVISTNKIKNLNLILISVDTLRSDHMGIYGYSKNTTPNIDLLAQKSTIFSNAYTIFPATRASFFALFTGSKKLKSVLSDDTSEIPQSFPEILGTYGYATAAFVTNSVLGEKSDYFKTLFKKYSYFYTKRSVKDYYDLVNEQKNSVKLTDNFLDWIKENKNKKLFTWLHYTIPHAPYNPPHAYLCKIDSDCNNKEYEKLSMSTWIDALPRKETELSKLNTVSEKDVELMKNLYDAEILATDEQIGIVLNKLKQYGLDKNSIIVIYGDHGEGFDHQIFQHGDALYESSVRIPLILFHPYFQNMTKSKTLVDNTDIFPFILDMLGIPYDKAAHDGIRKYVTMRSFVPSKRAITDGIYKYIEYDESHCSYSYQKKELYLLSKDREEKENISEMNPAVVARMRKAFLTEVPIITENQISSDVCIQNSSVLEKVKSLGY